MTFVSDVLKKLFGDKKEFSTHKENFTQSGEQEEGVRYWMDSAEGVRIFEQLHKAYHLRNAGVKEHPEVHILSSPYANGIAVYFEHPLTEKTFSNLFFAFGFRMLDLGYYRVSLDRTLQDAADLVKMTEKQYFKPSVPTFDAGKIDQRFGNVSIEKVSVDNHPSFLKVLVTVYSDQHYYDAQPFDQFIEELLRS